MDLRRRKRWRNATGRRLVGESRASSSGIARSVVGKGLVQLDKYRRGIPSNNLDFLVGVRETRLEGCTPFERGRGFLFPKETHPDVPFGSIRSIGSRIFPPTPRGDEIRVLSAPGRIPSERIRDQTEPNATRNRQRGNQRPRRGCSILHSEERAGSAEGTLWRPDPLRGS